MLVQAAVLKVAEEDEPGGVHGLRRDVGRVPRDVLRRRNGPHGARLGRGDLRQVDDVLVHLGRVEDLRGRGADCGRSGGEDGEGGGELGGEHVVCRCACGGYG